MQCAVGLICVLQTDELMKITQNTKRETVTMQVVVQTLGVRRIIYSSKTNMRRRKENVIRTTKLT